jgi:hypothetical protein
MNRTTVAKLMAKADADAAVKTCSELATLKD